MKTKNALILYGFGLAFGISGYFNRPVLVAGYVVFGILALIGIIFDID